MRTIMLSAALGLGALGLWGGGPSRAVAAPPGNQPTLIQVTVPAGAEIWFDGAKTSQSGTVRQFLTPPLDPSRHYHYEMRLHWMNGGQPMDETRRLAVQAGERIDISYANPGTAGSVATAEAPAFRESRSAYVPPAAPTVSALMPTYVESGGTPLGEAPPPRFYDERNYPGPGGPPGLWGKAGR
jgi:uncharacterized protein (TIGR03000 family)